MKIQFTYQTPKGMEENFYSEEMKIEKALLLAEDMQQTGRMKEITLIDHKGSHWSVKEGKKLIEEVKTEPHHITVYFDGGYDLESQRSGLGCAIYYEQNYKSFRIRKNALIDELESNNEAEYAAFFLALQELELLGVHHMPVTFIGDSKVVIYQLNGEWPCYEPELLKWVERIEEKIENLGIDPDYKLVSRTKNKEADHLATQALNKIEIMSNTEL